MSEPLIIRDLPGIADLEVNLVLRRNEYEGIQEDLAAAVARRLFGVSSDELFDFYEQYDDLFTSYERADDETMEEMLTMGVDFSDARGNPLRCTLFLAGYAEIAAKGLAGHLPDPDKATLDRLAANLERERDAFVANKGREAARSRHRGA